MKKFLLLYIAASIVWAGAQAQYQSTIQEGEFGISAGAAHYFGELNTRAGLNRPKPALGLFFVNSLATISVLG